MDQGPGQTRSERKSSAQPTLNNWVGHWIIVEYMAGPKIDENNPPAVDQIVEGQPVARNEMVILTGYDMYGIEFIRSPEDRTRFVSWGAVMGIRGPTPEEIEQSEQEDSEQSEEDAPPPDRQEAMDLLANAETPFEAADAKAAADGWLLTHPSDGDVRMARERLEDRFPEDTDTEEASQRSRPRTTYQSMASSGTARRRRSGRGKPG